MDGKEKLLKEILEDVNDDMSDEEIIHLLLDRKVTRKIANSKLTTGQKMADNLAKFAGSWVFIIIFMTILIIWLMYNSVSKNNFDPYPFILLNLILSCIAAIQAPIIMMSQNRQEQKDRERAENDYRVNVKTEIILSDLHYKIDELLEKQTKLINNDDQKAK